MLTLNDAAAALAAGTTTSRQLVETCLARIDDPAGEGGRVFLRVWRDQALATAHAMDALRRAGRAPGPFAGIPVSVKDLFDIAGEPTPAGSVVLADGKPALAHAPLIQRMISAGFVLMGRTNMTEFAFSGLGINPHHGTPRSPYDRATGRMPGGSSSGAAVSVADGMAFAALGTDTGGSCRVPAAMCGVVGYKPTARRVPLTGVLPLAPSLDSVGPLAPSVACCATVDAILAGEQPAPLRPMSLVGLRLVVPENLVLEGLDPSVAAVFQLALNRLAERGVLMQTRRFAPFDELAGVNRLGGFAAGEAYAWHRFLLAAQGDRYDQRIRRRIERGQGMTAADLLELQAARAALIAALDAQTADFDAVLMPTCPLIPQPIAALDDAVEYDRVNMMQLRNTSVGNFFDRCAISLPCHAAGEAPVGLMLMGETMGDAKLFRIAAAVEQALA